MSFLKLIFGNKGPKQVSIVNKDTILEVSPSETILERALKKGLNYRHDCTVGTCRSCRTKLLSGKVEAITPFGYALSKDELETGYILACQALVKSDLEIEVDIGGADNIEPVTQSAKLANMVSLTHDIKKITWEVKTPMTWRAGQYVNVRWNDGDQHRSYSFATAPSKEGSNQLVTFMRHVPGGALTDQFFLHDPAELKFEVNGPHGNFWLRDGKGPLLCIAGGSGLAPIVSLLQDAANRKIRRDIILLFGARTKKDLYGEKDIATIRNAWTAGFKFWQILSEDKAPDMRHGWVTDFIPEALEKLGSEAQAYMCGPPPMIDAGIAKLKECGISLDEICYDKFTDKSSTT